MNCCGTVKTKRHATGHRTQENEHEIGDVSAVMCKEYGGIHMLKNIHDTPVDGNFCDDIGNAIQPLTVANYNPHTCCVYKGHRMANRYSISCCT